VENRFPGSAMQEGKDCKRGDAGIVHMQRCKYSIQHGFPSQCELVYEVVLRGNQVCLSMIINRGTATPC